MNPTKAETDGLIAQYEADGDFYRELGRHNRQTAKQRIAEYQSRVDDLIETRVSGQRQIWPSEGLKSLVEGKVEQRNWFLIRLRNYLRNWVRTH